MCKVYHKSKETTSTEARAQGHLVLSFLCVFFHNR